MKKWLITIIGLTMILTACNEEDYSVSGEPLPYDPDNREALEPEEVSEPAGEDEESDGGGMVDIPDGLTDGAYETVGEGFGGDIVVETTIEGGEIVSIEILSHDETPGISDGAINDLPGTIVDEYSLGVDNVSGATVSSKAIKAAVEAAIAEAGGEGGGDSESAESADIIEIPEGLADGVYEATEGGFGGDIVVEVTVEGGEIVSIEVLSHDETPGISDGAINDLPGTIVSENSLGVDNVSGATVSSEAIKAAVGTVINEAGVEAGGGEDDSAAAAIPEDLEDGVYETTGDGFGGDIVVETTVEGGEIVSIEILSHDETPGISDGAINDLPGTIIDEYSLDVDDVSGATVSSKAIKAAVEEAIN